MNTHQQLGSRKEIDPQECAGFLFVYKAHVLVHIEICACTCNAVDGQKDQQDGDILISGALTCCQGFFAVHQPYKGEESNLNVPDVPGNEKVAS